MCALSLRRFTNFHSSLIGVHWNYIHVHVGLAVLKEVCTTIKTTVVRAMKFSIVLRKLPVLMAYS